MLKAYAFVICYLCSLSEQAQPYIDIAQFKYTHSPDAGLWRRNNQPNYFEHFSAAINVPFVSKKDSSIILLSPYAERWDFNITNAVGNFNDLPNHLYSLMLPFTYIRPLSGSWNITVSAIPRWNGNNNSVFKNSFQMGVAVLASYKKKAGLVLKAGLYYNAELSGPFFMPLLGIDWKIGDRDNLFGILPGSIVFEHKIFRALFGGLNFKATTNSYDAGFIHYNTNAGIADNERYLRIDENQLSLFFDFYFTKNFVLNMEAGHAVLRQLRLGLKDPATKYYYNTKMNDDLLLKVSLNYRLRLAGR